MFYLMLLVFFKQLLNNNKIINQVYILWNNKEKFVNCLFFYE
jgi:hypothetical protein